MRKSSLYIKGTAVALLMAVTACGKTDVHPQAMNGQEIPAEPVSDSGKAPYLEIWGAYSSALPTEKETAEIFVEPVNGLSQDFIRGMDISSLIAEEESGVVYYDEDGNARDLFEILADAGINYIRVRIWNHPYDADGNGYGGGNCDVEKAVQLGRRAAEHGMKLLVDFHYSDFWADPNKQYAPTEWARKDAAEKAELINEFTYQSLKTIYEGGANIGMVQIGNEINNGMCGVYDDDDKMSLLASASGAVR
ncbi:MAG: glycosyl hydrolase 53 family protein, partial [Lachnospiraceae bacterium]|nr:glycosyl hydrolase 53 family protein [Lachnospiraceae bacterium]